MMYISVRIGLKELTVCIRKKYITWNCFLLPGFEVNLQGESICKSLVVKKNGILNFQSKKKQEFGFDKMTKNINENCEKTIKK